MFTPRLGLGLACYVSTLSWPDIWARFKHKNAAGTGERMRRDVERQNARMQVPPHKTSTEYRTLSLRSEHILTHFADMLPGPERTALCGMPCSGRDMRNACHAHATCQIIMCDVSFGGIGYSASGTCRNCVTTAGESSKHLCA